jgi:hypothetical protein
VGFDGVTCAVGAGVLLICCWVVPAGALYPCSVGFT